MEIRDYEYKAVSNNLDDNQAIIKKIGEEWIQDNILNKEERERKHFLFWELFESNKAENLSKMILALEKENYFNSLISKLKKYRNKENFYPFLSELNVLYFYKTQENKKFKIKKYEPSLPDKKGKKNDILLEIEGEKYYIEIFTLMEDKIDRANRKLEALIDEELNRIPNNPFVIGYNYNDAFLKEDINDFKEFAEKHIEYAKKSNLEYHEFEFKKDDLIKARMRLYPSKSGKGFVGLKMGDFREINNDNRLKNIMLSKIDLQLCNNTKNILVVNLSTPLSHFEDFYNAVLGSETVRVDLQKNKFEEIRKNNGIIHDPKERAKYVSSFIAFERLDYGSRKKIFITNANNPIDEKIQTIL